MGSVTKKEVYFGDYCNLCDHKTTKGEDEPCFTCLKVGARDYSHIPIKYSGPKPTTKKDWKEKK